METAMRSCTSAQNTVFILLIICVLPLSASAQIKQTKVDSLLTIARSNRSATIRIDAYVDLAEIFSGWDNKRALLYANDAVKLASTHPTTGTLVHAYHGRAQAFYDLNKYKEAKTDFERMLQIAEEARDSSKIALALSGVGRVQTQTGSIKTAQQTLDKARIIATRCKDSLALASVLSEMARNYKTLGALDKAIEYAEFSKDVFSASEYHEGTGSMLHLLALLSRDKKRYTAALDYGKQSLENAERLGNISGMASSIFAMGTIYSAMGKPDSAMACFKRDMDLFLQVDDSVGWAATLNHISHMHRGQNRFSEALDGYNRSLRVFESRGMTHGIGIQYNNIIATYEQMEQYDEMIWYSEKSANIFRLRGDHAEVFRILGNLARKLSSLARYAEALKYFRQSAAAAQTLKDSSKIGVSLVHIGHMLYELGSYEQAVDHLIQGLGILEPLDNRKGMAMAYNGLGLINKKLKRDELAFDYFQRYLEIQQALGNETEVAGIWINISHIHSENGQFALAIDAAKRSRKTFEAHGHQLGTATALGRMGEIHALDKNYDTALVYLEASMKIFDNIKNLSGCTGARIDIAQLLHDQGNIDAAITLGLEALKMAKESGARDSEAQITKILSQCHAAKGDYVTGYEHQKNFSALNDSLLTAVTVRSINELNAVYESERKEQKISLLEKDTALRLLELKHNRQELALQASETERFRQRALLFDRQRALQTEQLRIRSIALDLKTSESDLLRAEKLKNESELKYQKDINKLHASIFSREKSLRNSVIIGIILLLSALVLNLKRVRGMKREAVLRAESAELQTRVARAETNALISASERRRKEEMEAFTHRLIQSQEQERSRIARELHDSVGQELLVIKNQAHMAMQKAGDAVQMVERMQKVKDITLEVLEEIRQLSRNLRPVQLERSGLSSTVRDMLLQMEEASAVHMNTIIDDLDGLFAPEAEINVYRILQESMNNVHKHAHAKEVSVKIRRSRGDVLMYIEDDGRGFEPERKDGGPFANGFGLQGMQERVQILKGRMHVDSSPGKGTRIEIMLPLNATQPARA